MTGDQEPTLDVAHGDRAFSDQLRHHLATLRAHTTDRAARLAIDDVLAGRTGLRDVANSPPFLALLDVPPRAGVSRPSPTDEFDVDGEDYGGRGGHTFLR